MKKWINVNSVLPEINKKWKKYIHKRTIDVLVTDGECIYMAFAMIDKDTGKVLSWYNQESLDLTNITHWMYLPELPSQNDKTLFEIDFTEESISVNKDDKEVVFWHIDEWTEDPSIVFSIANAVKMAAEQDKNLVKINQKHLDSQR